MRRRRVVKTLNILILATVILALAALVSLLLTALQTTPSVALGKIITQVSGPTATISIPTTITNKGPLTLSDILIFVSVRDGFGTELLQGNGGPFTVPPGSTSSVAITVSLDLAKIPKDTLNKLITNSENLSVQASLKGSVPPLASLSGSASGTVRWGAPISNLTTGSPAVRPLNSTHMQVSVPVSFANDNDIIDIHTTVNAEIFNATSNSSVGSGRIAIDAPHHTKFSGNLTAIVALPKTVSTLIFNDKVLAYQVLLQGTYSSFQFGFSRTIQVNWGAPLANFAIGSPSLNSFNSSGIQVSVPVSFQNHSPWIGINTPVSITVHNSTSGEVLATATLRVNAPPMSAFNEKLPLSVKFSQSFLDSLLFKDNTVPLSVDFAGEYAGFPFSAQNTFSFQWGAPLSGFALGKAGVVSFNSTGIGISTIISFTNHLPAPFYAPVSISIANATSGSILGSGTSLISAPAGSDFSQRLNLVVKPGQDAMSTLLFNDRNVSLTLNISTQLLGVNLSGSKTITFFWGAPVKSLALGVFSVQSYNTTKAQFVLPFNFTNNSTFLVLNGTLSGIILDQSGNQIGSVNSISLSAPSQKLFSGKLSGFLDVASTPQHQFVLKLAFQGLFGTVTRVVTISA